MFRQSRATGKLKGLYLMGRAQDIQVFLDESSETLVDEENLQSRFSFNEVPMIRSTCSALFSHEFSRAVASRR